MCVADHDVVGAVDLGRVVLTVADVDGVRCRHYLSSSPRLKTKANIFKPQKNYVIALSSPTTSGLYCVTLSRSGDAGLLVHTHLYL